MRELKGGVGEVLSSGSKINRRSIVYIVDDAHELGD